MTKKYSLLAILEAFAVFSKDHLYSRDLHSNTGVDFVEFLDTIDELAKNARLQVEDTANIERVRQLVLRVLIKNYYVGKNRRNLQDNVQKVSKLYRVSYIDLDDPCQYIDREILIEYDEAAKLHVDETAPQAEPITDIGEFSNVLNKKQELFDYEEIEKVRLDLLKKHYKDSFGKVKRQTECNRPFVSSEKPGLKNFIKDWVYSMDLSLALFAEKEQSLLRQLVAEDTTADQNKTS